LNDRATDIDGYLAIVPDSARKALEELRRTIRSIAPEIRLLSAILREPWATKNPSTDEYGFFTSFRMTCEPDNHSTCFRYNARSESYGGDQT
jgi:hypothetical protein